MKKERVMSVKNNVEMRYDAFISYRHSELDKFVAEELHKQLENFKIPKNIAKAKCEIVKYQRGNIFIAHDDELIKKTVDFKYTLW